ncbi:MAG: DUF4351 domain-containing protein [Candidatus Sericytochromatia bacterium]|nr:DUF4351 domain-containing protein [Candidatus Sericytochromatia bacterium]
MPPSLHHEALLALLRDAPDLITAHVRTLDASVTAHGPARVVDATLTAPLPAERRADLVLLSGPDHAPDLAVVVEVQLRVDLRKRKSWPTYVTALHTRHDCPVALVVVTPDPVVATWASRPIPLGPGGSRVVPLVLGPEGVAEPPEGSPHVAILRALVACRGPGDRPVLSEALAALEALPEDLRVGYHEMLLLALAAPLSLTPEVKMALNDISGWIELAKKRIEKEGLERGLQRGMEQGLQQGLEQGLEQGRKEEVLRVVALQLGRRTGLPGADALARLEALGVEDLEALCVDLLDFGGPEDLAAWLAARG